MPSDCVHACSSWVGVPPNLPLQSLRLLEPIAKGCQTTTLNRKQIALSGLRTQVVEEAFRGQDSEVSAFCRTPD